MALPDTAAVLRCTPSKISRIETGHRGLTELELWTLLNTYGVPEDDRRREALLTLAKGARRRDWWDREFANLIADSPYRDYLTLETDAEELCSFQTDLIPGLLQTTEYARAVITAGHSYVEPAAIDSLVALRETRQQETLFRTPNPLRLKVIVDEWALRRVIGSHEIMATQLTHLLDVSKQLRKTLTLQVIPQEAGAHPGLDGPFVLVRFPDEAHPSVVWFDLRIGGVYLENEADLELHTRVWEDLSMRALGPRESAELIAAVAKEHTR